jgi:parallel beta-helix repeat protein
MKRPLTIVTIAILIFLFVYACSSTIHTAKTSFVTITIGSDARKATLHAEGATPWARFKYFLADAKLMPEAYAYIPSVVQVLVVTVSAADMTTPIVGIDSIKPDQTISTIRIEVPNGSGRTFTVEGIRGVDSQTYYRGTAIADLSGTDVNLAISMNFVGTGIYVDPALDPQTADQSTCGTQANPCATIAYVLNARPSTTDNDVILALAGTYKHGTVAAQESFPLQLKPGMVLLCMGANFSSVIDVTGFFATAILGNEGAAVDNCMIKVGVDSNGIDDQAARTRINGAYIELSGSPSETSIVGVLLSNDSLLLESTVTGSAASGSVFGVRVLGGKPAIINSTISNLSTGIDLAVSADDAEITGNTITGNWTAGISIATNAKPSISANIIENNGKGISIPSGSPDIEGNTIDHNYSVGIDISSFGTGTATGKPRVKGNSIFCNFSDVNVVSDEVIDLRNNAWDHDNTTVAIDPFGPTIYPPGPLVGQGFNYGGYDIIYSVGTPTPQYVPFSTAVSGGCVTITVSKPRR